jgi:hypothetical protein
MKPALFRLPWPLRQPLTVAAVSSRAQAPGVYALHEVPEGATLHKVTADPAEYKGRKALKVEFTEAANKERPGGGGDMPTFVLIPTNFKNGTIEVDLLGRLNGKGLPDARAFVGLAYRVDDEARFEAVYLRPLNGRKKILSPRATSARSNTSPIGLEIRPAAQGVSGRALRVRRRYCRRRMDHAQARRRRHARQSVDQRQGGTRVDGY